MVSPSYYCCALAPELPDVLQQEAKQLVEQLQARAISLKQLSWTAPQALDRPPLMGELFWTANGQRLFRLPHPNAELRAVRIEGLAEAPVEDWRFYAEQGLYLKAEELLPDPYRERLFHSKEPGEPAPVVEALAEILAWPLQQFRATTPAGVIVRRTQHVLSVARSFSLVALGALYRDEELRAMYQALRRKDRDLIEVELEQIQEGVAEGMELFDEQGNSHWLMSERAWRSLNRYQQSRIESYSKVLPVAFEHWQASYGCAPKDMLSCLSAA